MYYKNTSSKSINVIQGAFKKRVNPGQIVFLSKNDESRSGRAILMMERSSATEYAEQSKVVSNEQNKRVDRKPEEQPAAGPDKNTDSSSDNKAGSELDTVDSGAGAGDASGEGSQEGSETAAETGSDELIELTEIPVETEEAIAGDTVDTEGVANGDEIAVRKTRRGKGKKAE